MKPTLRFIRLSVFLWISHSFIAATKQALSNLLDYYYIEQYVLFFETYSYWFHVLWYILLLRQIWYLVILYNLYKMALNNDIDHIYDNNFFNKKVKIILLDGFIYLWSFSILVWIWTFLGTPADVLKSKLSLDDTYDLMLIQCTFVFFIILYIIGIWLWIRYRKKTYFLLVTFYLWWKMINGAVSSDQIHIWGICIYMGFILYIFSLDPQVFEFFKKKIPPKRRPPYL